MSKKVQPIRNVEKIQEVKNYLREKSYRDYFLFTFGINSGLRISDILNLKVEDVKDKKTLRIREEKTDKLRTVHIRYGLQLEIENYIKGMKDEALLFKSQRGYHPISRIQAYRILKDAANHVGLEEIGTHTLRKTFGYHFYQANKDVAMLQQIYGHESPSITLRYIGINDELIHAGLDNMGYL